MKKSMAMKTKASQPKKAAKKKNIADTYNAWKKFEGTQYTGMKIGRSHKWYYDKGVWHDKKITPDKWEISYEVTKRRAGHAPEGSGVPVGTEYHWYILAHQMVKKLNADDYSTSMTGMKFKLAHKRADKDKWNITEKGQRKRLIKLLKEMIAQLEKEPMEMQENVEPEVAAPKKATPARKRTTVKLERTLPRAKKPARPSKNKTKAKVR
jgi:hypothetical protein